MRHVRGYIMVRAITYSAVNSSLAVGDAIYPYTFCFPNVGSSPFFAGLEKTVPQGADQAILGQLLKGRTGEAVLVKDGLPGGLPQGLRFYDISSYMPPYMREKLGTAESVPGPNCYHTVMSIVGGEQFEDRYVHDAEISYYLTRDFESSADRGLIGSAFIYVPYYGGADAGRYSFAGDGESEELHMDMETPEAGGLVIYPEQRSSIIPPEIGTSLVHSFVEGQIPDVQPEVFSFAGSVVGFASAAEPELEPEPEPAWEIIPRVDPGVHGAITLLAGMVFQKGCFGTHCPYRIVPADRAMSSIEMKQPRIGSMPERENDGNFRSRCYVPVGPDHVREFGFNAKLSEQLSVYPPLIRYYADRIRRVKDKTWSDFKSHRIDLMSIENLWKLLSEVGEAMRAEPNSTNAYLRVDPEIAELLLELQSLKWQYQAMVNEFAPFRDTWSDRRRKEKLEELYRDNYIHPEGDDFRREVEAHLAMRGVDEDRWNSIAARVIQEVKKYNPVDFASSNGSRGISFHKILTEALRG